MIPNASGLRNAAAPTSTAAMPTRLWKAATSCGIAVIWMRRAVTRPIAAADDDGNARSPAIEAMLVDGQRGRRPQSPCRPCRARLPRRLLAGLDRPRSARMKQMPGDQISDQHPGRAAPPPHASRRSFFLYIASIRAVTAKPPKMFTEASADRDQPEPFRGRAAARRGRDQRADDDHRGNGVGHRHQRRVQRRGHRPDDEIADEAGQHENRQDRDEVHGRLPRMNVPGFVAAPARAVEGSAAVGDARQLTRIAVSYFLTFSRHGEETTKGRNRRSVASRAETAVRAVRHPGCCCGWRSPD